MPGPEGRSNSTVNPLLFCIIGISAWYGRRLLEARDRECWLMRYQQQFELKRLVLLQAFADATVLLHGQPPVNIADSNMAFDVIFRTPMVGTDLRLRVLPSEAGR